MPYTASRCCLKHTTFVRTNELASIRLAYRTGSKKRLGAAIIGFASRAGLYLKGVDIVPGYQEKPRASPPFFTF
ncbi:hypothetical protein BN2476_920003 [Paraburkholderia piptadeniae]|uniref:Uncharacterized protein n=1 Tax=Paraburkholderia piptadeniae TaxID=1701573 RepID=A0A1N7STL2_9BURK|nr:hypothetical protein BN2476_920003 [Paraburkholderia piptadeniae]